MSEIFLDLTIILALCLMLSLVVRFLRQPMIIAYILTGVIAGPAAANLINYSSAFESFSQIGVVLLLFIVGLGLKPKIFKEVGRVAVISGLAQIVFTTMGGFALARFLGLADVAALYVALAFSLSSTIIIAGLLYAKEEQDTLYGRIAIGFLLVQDLVAFVAFMILASFGGEQSASFSQNLLMIFVKLLVTAGIMVFLVNFVVPKIDKHFAGNREMLFVFALVACFGAATAFNYLNFSMELGALAAGVVFATSPYQREIAAKLSPLRDFFLIIFFIGLGSKVNIADVAEFWQFILFFSLFILIANPLIMLAVMRWLGYTFKTSFLAGLTVAQISEFSLILLAFGASLGQVPENLLGPATIVGLVTILVSSYYISYNHQLCRVVQPWLKWLFPHGKLGISALGGPDFLPQVVVFGCHRLGGGLVIDLQKMKLPFLVVDHDPEVIRILEDKKIPALYGSADDTSILEILKLAKVKMVISTIPEVDVNRFLNEYLHRSKSRAEFICVSNHLSEAKELYDAGVSYVIMPPYLGRRFMGDILKKNKFDGRKYARERKRHLADWQLFGHNQKHIVV